MVDGYFTVALPAPPRRKPKPLIEDLTATQYECLRALDEAIRRHGNPSLLEIAACSATCRYGSMVHKYLRQLALKGWVALPERQRSRGIRMLRDLPDKAA